MNGGSKKIVIVNQDVGYLFVDLANSALNHYDEVVLISGSVVELGSRLDSRVRLIKICRYRRTSTVSRLFSWMCGCIQVAWLLWTRFRQYEVLVASNPPLNGLLPLLIKNKIGLYILDLYPEALYKTGMASENSLVVKAWSKLNSRAYSRFKIIWVLTPSMKTLIKRRYDVQANYAPAWASEVSAELDSKFLENENMHDSWVVLYSGNLGREHDVGCLIECAAKLAHSRRILFVIAGQGWKKRGLEKEVREQQLSNVRFLTKLPSAEFYTLINHARIGVVTQSPKTSDVCIPSKTFNLLASNVPILGIGDPNSDFGRLINDSGSGHVFSADDASGMSNFIFSCFNSRETLARYQKSTLEASKLFTPENAVRLIDQFANDAC